MQTDYSDILERISEEPKWWDENAAPRYVDFEPSKIAEYAKATCLLLVECQQCGREFQVCISEHMYLGTRYVDPTDRGPSLEELVEARELEYGDPPQPLKSCCNGGWSMTSVPIRVLQFWHRADVWVRVPELEKDVKPEWADQRL